mmetsp:Transcript_94397/g.211622  ORF Transcript_94397/g.211622 Transcript_94397/m.211622 type:complete len:243 (-) Transcript_94397:2-730(-)
MFLTWTPRMRFFMVLLGTFVTCIARPKSMNTGSPVSGLYRTLFAWSPLMKPPWSICHAVVSITSTACRFLSPSRIGFGPNSALFSTKGDITAALFPSASQEPRHFRAFCTPAASSLFAKLQSFFTDACAALPVSFATLRMAVLESASTSFHAHPSAPHWRNLLTDLIAASPHASMSGVSGGPWPASAKDKDKSWCLSLTAAAESGPKATRPEMRQRYDAEGIGMEHARGDGNTPDVRGKQRG